LLSKSITKRFSAEVGPPLELDNVGCFPRWVLDCGKFDLSVDLGIVSMFPMFDTGGGPIGVEEATLLGEFG